MGIIGFRVLGLGIGDIYPNNEESHGKRHGPWHAS